jgi:hypothetical protein
MIFLWGRPVLNHTQEKGEGSGNKNLNLFLFFFCTTPVSRLTEIYSQEKERHIFTCPFTPPDYQPTCDTVYR